MVKGLNWKGKLINAFSRYQTWYNKGITVLAVVRNMELSDLGILMAAGKYLFGDHISTMSIVIIGGCYWIFNAIVNITVGRFWERNNGWQIEAEVFGSRIAPGRTVLVSPDGKPYDARELNHGKQSRYNKPISYKTQCEADNVHK